MGHSKKRRLMTGWPIYAPVAVLLALAAWSSNAYAQAPGGSVRGTVMTSLEDTVADAKVVLKSGKSGEAQSASSDKNGEFHLSGLQPGLYDFSVNAEGFRSYSLHSIRVDEAPVEMDVTLQRAKDETFSLKDLEAAVADKPDDVVARFRLGQSYYAAGNLEKSLQQFGKILELRPDYVPARLSLGQLALRHGAPQRALQYADQVLKTKPKNVPAMLLKSSANVRMAKFDESRQVLEQVLKNNPNQVEALLELGVLDLLQKRFDEAELPFRRAYVLDSSNLRGILGVAEIRFLKNEPLKGVEVIANEVALEPQRGDLRKELATIEFRVKLYDKAIADFQLSLDRYKDSPLEQADILARLGETYAATGDVPRALETFTRAAQTAPNNSAIKIRLAGLLERTGKKQEALAVYMAAFKIDPNNGILMNNLAFLIADTGGDLDAALTMAQKARQQFPESSDILDTIGWIYLKKDLPDSANRVFADLVEKYPKNPLFHYHYAMALVKKSDKVAAQKQLDLALENNLSKEDEATIKELIRKLP